MDSSEQEQLDCVLHNLQHEKEHPLYCLYVELVLGGPGKLQSILAVHSASEENEIIAEEMQDKVISGTLQQYLKVEDSLRPKIQFQLTCISFEFVKISQLILIRSLKHCGNLEKLILQNVELVGECDLIITLPKLTHYTWLDVNTQQDLNPLHKNENHPMWFFNSVDNGVPGLASFWNTGKYLDFQSSDFKLKIDKDNAVFQCGGISWSHRYEIEESYMKELLSYLQVTPRIFKLQNVFLHFNPIIGLQNKSLEIKELELSDLKLDSELLKEILASCSENIDILTLANSWRPDAEILSMTNFTSLKITSLTIKNMEISLESDLNCCVDSLEMLDMIGCKLPKDFLSKVELMFPALTSIAIFGCEFGTEKGISGNALELLMKLGTLRFIHINGSGDNPAFHWGWGVFSQATKQLQTILKKNGSSSYVTSAKFQRIGEDRWRYIPGYLP